VNAEQQALAARFDGFLAKLFGRQAELMDEAEQGMKALTAEYPDDFMPLSNAATGIDHRMRQLRERIQEAWDQQIDQQFSDLGDGHRVDGGLALTYIHHLRTDDEQIFLGFSVQTFVALIAPLFIRP